MYTDYTEDENNEYDDYYSDDGDKNNNFDKEKIKKIAFLILSLVIVVVLIIVIAKSCSNKKNNPTSVNGNGNLNPAVLISMESSSIEVEQEIQLYAGVTSASVESPVIGWQTEDSNVATVEDLGDNTALIKGIQEGTTNIVAIYRENGKTYSDKCKIIVTSKAVSLERIDIVQENVTMSLGKTLLLEIKVIPEEAKVPGLTYISDNPKVASVSEEGKVNALSLGTAIITVKTEDELLSDTVRITVTDNGQMVINPTGLNLVGMSNGLKVGGTAQIEVQFTPSGTTNRALTWSSSNPDIATVNSNGVVTGIKAGKTTIVATTSNGISSSLDVTVESNTVPVSGITINTASPINLNCGGAKIISYTVNPSNATNKKVLFTSSNRNIVTVDSNGIIGARQAGSAVITLTSEDGKKTASITVNVVGKCQMSASSSGSSGSSTGTGSSGGSGSSGSYIESDASCNDSLMTYITHNGQGAIISQYSFGQAKAFQNMSTKPAITITKIADCINSNRLTYKVFYGTSSTNVSTISNGGSGSIKKVGNKITLNNGDGYYKIELTGYLSNNANVDLKKTYYAIVQNNGIDTIKPYINSVTVSRSSTTRLSVTTSINETGSGIKTLKYCLTTSIAKTCTPAITLYMYTSSYPKVNNSVRTSYVYNESLASYKKICVNATDVAGNVSTFKCTNF